MKLDTTEFNTFQLTTGITEVHSQQKGSTCTCKQSQRHLRPQTVLPGAEAAKPEDWGAGALAQLPSLDATALFSPTLCHPARWPTCQGGGSSPVSSSMSHHAEATQGQGLHTQSGLCLQAESGTLGQSQHCHPAVTGQVTTRLRVLPGCSGLIARALGTTGFRDSLAFKFWGCMWGGHETTPPPNQTHNISTENHAQNTR